jgi:hypothetical protein
MTGSAGDGLSFLEGRLPDAFELRLMAVSPGRELAFEEAEWRDALVVVERGEIELESAGGDGRRFERGAVLCLCGLRLQGLRNRGREPVLLSVVSRRR